MNNLKYEGFALLFTPLDNINYCREPSSMGKGKKKSSLKKLQALQVFKGPSATPPKLYRQMRAAIAHIYSVDIMATFPLLSQPRTSTKNIRLAVPQALLSVGNAAEILAGLNLRKESPGVLGTLPLRTAAHLLLAGFPTILWAGWPLERCLTQANKQ